MKTMFWLAVAFAVAVIALIFRYVLRKISDRERASEARAAEFMVQVAGAKLPAAAPAPTAAAAPDPGALEIQKLLLEAARKAGDAGEPAIAAQLYGRLLARFPESGFASEARAASEAQKKRIKA
jgi:hypothetical protein